MYIIQSLSVVAVRRRETTDYAYDIQQYRWFIDQSTADDQYREVQYEKLQAITDYANTPRCLQQQLVEYFGQSCDPCGHCSNCTDDRQLEDITPVAKEIIATVNELHGRFGKSLVAKVVTGSHDQRVRQLHVDQLDHYGALKLSQQAAGSLVDYLVATGFLELEGGQFPVVKVGKPGWRVLAGKATIQRRVEPQPTKVATKIEETPEQAALFECLRKRRLELARDQEVPPFMIFSDRTLHDMARLQPQTPAEFLEVNGVGQAKLKKYGQIMMDEIGAYLSGNED